MHSPNHLNSGGWLKSLVVCVYVRRKACNLEKDSKIWELPLFYHEFLKYHILRPTSKSKIFQNELAMTTPCQSFSITPQTFTI